jgi:pilus assembly protein CpaF
MAVRTRKSVLQARSIDEVGATGTCTSSRRPASSGAAVAAGLNVLSGGTQAGKTTLVGATAGCARS